MLPAVQPHHDGGQAEVRGVPAQKTSSTCPVHQSYFISWASLASLLALTEGSGLSVSMVGETRPTTREPQSEEASSRSDLGGDMFEFNLILTACCDQRHQ